MTVVAIPCDICRGTTEPCPHGMTQSQHQATKRFWRSSVEMREQFVIGEPWPVAIVVTRWEENALGERRIAGVQTYVPVKQGATE